MKPELLTVTETAALLRVTPKTIWRMVNRGDLKAVKVGSRWRVHRIALNEALGATNGD